MSPARVIIAPLPAETMEMLDSYVVRNAVSREAVITAALIMFLHAWETMGSNEGAE